MPPNSVKACAACLILASVIIFFLKIGAYYTKLLKGINCTVAPISQKQKSLLQNYIVSKQNLGLSS